MLVADGDDEAVRVVELVEHRCGAEEGNTVHRALDRVSHKAGDLKPRSQCGVENYAPMATGADDYQGFHAERVSIAWTENKRTRCPHPCQLIVNRPRPHP